MELTSDRILAIVGIIAAIILVVLDKGGKLKGPFLLILLAIAALITLPMALGNSWVKDTPWGMLRFSKMALMASIVALCYSAFALWIAQPTSPEVEIADTKPPATQPGAGPVSKPVESAPKLISSIDQIYIAGNTRDAKTVGETLIVLVVTIQNTGDPTTVIDYRLEVDIPNRLRPEFFLAKIPDTLKSPGRTRKDKDLVFYAADSLPDKTFSNPLTKDAPVRGIVVFVSKSVTPPELYKPGVGLSLIFKDAKGLYYKITSTSLNLGKITGQSFIGLRSGPQH